MSSSLASLATFVRPLSAERFITEHWLPGKPFVSEPSDELVTLIRSLPGLYDFEALKPHLTSPVKLFGPGGFRSDVTAANAPGFLRLGFNLYVHDVEVALPQHRAVFATLAQELGFAPWMVALEAFAGTPGAVSTRHYDHDINFQILLAGEKRWKLEANHNIENPLRAYHPIPRKNGGVSGTPDEALAVDPNFPTAFDEQKSWTLEAKAGTIVFLPRGYWHEVTSLTDTWAINVVFRGVTWAGALGNAIVNRLQEDPRFRGYTSGIAYGDSEPTAEQRAEATTTLEAMRSAAVSALSKLDLAEVVLAPIGATFRWKTEARKIERRDGQAFLVLGDDPPVDLEDALVGPLSKLVSLREPFSWSHAQIVFRGVSAVGVYNLINELVQMGALSRVEAKK